MRSYVVRRELVMKREVIRRQLACRAFQDITGCHTEHLTIRATREDLSNPNFPAWFQSTALVAVGDKGRVIIEVKETE